ncbi:MAG: hypothetical protein IJ595_08495 [Oscillospiraceae bacterium]|nr:hypothetical protein [Oscillospiraceae bacterium]
MNQMQTEDKPHDDLTINVEYTETVVDGMTYEVVSINPIYEFGQYTETVLDKLRFLIAES